MTTFLQNVLGFSDPGWASSNPQRKRDATVAEALVEAARRAETELADEPEALAAVHFTIGNTGSNAEPPEAEPHLRAALEIRRRVLGDKHPETGQSMVALAEWCVLGSANNPEAESLFREAIPIFRAAHDAKWLAIALNDSAITSRATRSRPPRRNFCVKD